MKKILTYILSLLVFTGCIQEDSFDNNAIGNFDALWSIIDQRYCFFDYAEKEYGLNWDAVYNKYRLMISEETTDEELFDMFHKGTSFNGFCYDFSIYERLCRKLW